MRRSTVATDPRHRTSRTCPGSSKGLHARGFEYMRLSEGIEGGISNFERTVDGFLAGLPYEQLLPALQSDQREPARAARRRPRPLRANPSGPGGELRGPNMSYAARRRRRGRPGHPGRLRPGAGRRSDRRRRRHLLPGRYLRDPRPGHHTGPRRPPAGLRTMEAPAAPTPRRPQHPCHRVERRRGHGRSATSSSCCRSTPAGRMKLVGRYHDVLHSDGSSWRFHNRTATFVTEEPLSTG